MKLPQPVLVSDLFPELLDGLLDLLSGISAEGWQKPTSCPEWTIKDVAQHLLGGDISILSRKRDKYSSVTTSVRNWQELLTLIIFS